MAEMPGRGTFVGRGAELARLDLRLAAVADERAGRTIVIGGEAGIGKSRLIERFAERARPAAMVLVGACQEVASEALPYTPFVEIMRELVRHTPDARLPALLGPGRAELTRLLPELAARAADLPAAGEVDRGSQARLFELVLGVFERLAADRPLVLVVEDVQWADRSTRDLVGFLSRALRDDPVLLVLTTRTDGGEAVGNLAFLAELEREDHVERLDLRPLDRDEVAEQAASLLQQPLEPEDLDRLAARSDGNPFYVEELCRSIGHDANVPRVLRDVIAARVATVSDEARDVLRAAAAAGRRVDDELLSAALGLPARQLAPALREALESGILVRAAPAPGSESVSTFRHALLHEVVSEELFAGERVALHRAFATALEGRLEAGDGRVAAVEIARHWDGAREPSRALPFMIRAAAGAEGVYAFAEALGLWERAGAMFEDLDLTGEVEGRDHVDVLQRAAECALLAGEPGRAVALAQRALVVLLPGGDPDRVEQLETRFRWYLWWSGARASAVDAVRRALAETPSDQPSLGRARALAQEAGILMLAGDLARSRDLAREAIAMSLAVDAHAETALALCILGWDLAVLGDVDAGIAEFQRGQAIGEALGSIEGMSLAAANLAALLDRVGRSEASLEAARSGYALTERFGVARTYGAVLLGHAAKAELALGRWDEVERLTSLGLRRGAIDAGALWLQVNRARLLTGRGAFAEAEVLLRRARAVDVRLGGTEYRTALLAAEAELAIWSGRPRDALAIGEEGLETLRALGTPDPSLGWLATLVLRAAADIRQGAEAPEHIADATAFVAEVELAIETARSRPGFATGERAEAMLAQLAGERSRVAARHEADTWADAAGRWTTLARPYAVAYAEWREAEAVLGTRGERDRAVAALRDAASIAERLGAQPLRAAVEQLARQAGISLPTGAHLSRDGSVAAPARLDLTPREGEVLRLVAAGWTNQQIADRLFITRKTASVHVSNIMSKLGASNRGEAAALAHRLSLVLDTPLPVGHT